MTTNFAHGRLAEIAAAEFLQSKGYEIVESNWRTKWCEIDIVARKQNHIVFAEVKYRQNSKYGQGFDYITNRKLKQMMRAAESWVQSHYWNGEYQIAAIEVFGVNFQISDFVIIG